MTIWIIGAAALFALTLVYVLWPLWRGVRTDRRARHREAVLAALREERRQLDEALAQGLISEAAHAAAVEELRARVLAETQTEEGTESSAPPESARSADRLAAGVAAAGLVLVTSLIYMIVGSPTLADDERVAQIAAEARANAAGQPSITPEQIAQLVANLAARLEAQPEDIAGWRMLARSYFVLQDAAAVESAWQRLKDKVPADADVRLDWGELLAAARGGFDEESARLIESAVAQAPNSPRALALAGAVASERGNPDQAIAYWSRLLPLTADNPEARAAVEAAIAEEEKKRAR